MTKNKKISRNIYMAKLQMGIVKKSAVGSFKKTKSKRRPKARMSKALISSSVYHFKRNFETIPLGSISNTTEIEEQDTNNGLSFQFKLSDLPGVSDFANLFDDYRINKVVLKLIPQITSSNMPYNAAAGAGAGTGLGRNPRVFYAADYDDSNVVTSINALRQYGNVKVRPVVGNKPIKIIITPAISQEILRTPSTTAYAPKWKQWLDLAYNDVPHYGIKMWVEDCDGIAAGTPTAAIFKVEGTMYFSCKATR